MHLTLKILSATLFFLLGTVVLLPGQASTNKVLAPERVMSRQQSFVEKRMYPFDRLPLPVLSAGKSQSPSLASTYQWKEEGPFSVAGRMTDIAIVPQREGMWVATAAAGGVWKTTNAGNRWQQCPTDNVPTLASGAIAINPFEHSEWLYGTGEPNFAHNNYPGVGIFASRDSGATWEPRGADDIRGSIAKIAYHQHIEGLVFAACAGFGGFPGVYRSTDGGNRWALVLGGTAAMDVVVSPVEPALVYATLSFPFGDSLNGIYRSLDTGRTWQKLSGGLPTNHGRVALAVAPANPSLVVALISNTQGGMNGAGLYRSTDTGATFQRIDNAPANLFGEAQVGQGWYDIAVAISPVNPGEIYIGGVTLHRTTNGGQSWSNIQPIHVDIHALRFLDGSRLLAAHDGGISLITNGVPTDRVQNLVTTQFYKFDPIFPSQLAGGTQDNGIVIGAGQQWRQPVGGDIVGVARFSRLPNVLVLATSFGTMFRSTDTGYTWQQANQGIALAEPADWEAPLTKGNGDTLLTGRARVYRSTDMGSSWQAISPVLAAPSIPITAVGQSPEHGRIFFAGTKNGNIYRTLNDGNTWELVSDTLPFRVPTSLTGNPLRRENFAVTFSGFAAPHVWMTTDAGATWQNVAGNLPDVPVNCFLFDTFSPFSTWFVGTDLGAYVTYDSGRVWHPMMEGMGVAPVLDLKFGSDGRLYAGTYGRGIFSLDPGTLPVELSFFEAFRHGENVHLHWETVSEEQSAYFVVERVEQQKLDVSTIAKERAGGNSAVPRSYQATDYNAPQERLEYRLRAIDLDGSSEIVGAAQVDAPFITSQIAKSPFPNPFSYTTTIPYDVPKGGSVEVVLFDVQGRKVRTLLAQNFHNRGSFTIEWNGADQAGSQLPQGLYFVRISTTAGVQTSPVLKQ